MCNMTLSTLPTMQKVQTKRRMSCSTLPNLVSDLSLFICLHQVYFFITECGQFSLLLFVLFFWRYRVFSWILPRNGLLYLWDQEQVLVALVRWLSYLYTLNSAHFGLYFNVLFCFDNFSGIWFWIIIVIVKGLRFCFRWVDYNLWKIWSFFYYFFYMLVWIFKW